MADVYTLLTLPKTSNAFSALSTQSQAAASSRESSRSASPPRKIARLDGSSDTHSVSASSTRAGVAEPVEKRGPVILRVIGQPVKPTPQSVYDADLMLLRRTIKIILTPDNSATLPATYDRVSRACRAVVAEAGDGEGLYGDVKLALEQCVGEWEKTLIEESSKSVDWLIPFTKACTWFETQVGLLQSLFAYLDTMYIAEKTQNPSIQRLAYTLFTNNVVRSARITQLILHGLADWLEWERPKRKQHAHRAYLPQVVRYLRAYGLYDDIVEYTYIDLTHAFYTKESAQLVDQNVTADDFLRRLDERLKEEGERAQEVLLDRSVTVVKDTTLKALVTGRLPWLAKDALQVFFDTEDDTRIARMYKTFAKVGGLKVLTAAFKAHVQQKVKEVVTDIAKDEDMVPRLLGLKAFADKLVQTVFVDEVSPPSTGGGQPIASTSSAMDVDTAPEVQSNRDFVYSLRDAFQAGFKARRNKPAEMIAKHMDKALRRGQKGKQDTVFEQELDRVLELYVFTDDMDVFRTFYQRALAKRLLLGRSASDDFEKSVLKKLQRDYDPEFGMGDLMFKDLDVSRSLMEEFLKHAAQRGDASRVQKMNVMVLQRSNWPFAARKTDVDLPVWMADDLKKYMDFYRTKHQAHKLDWDHALGTANLKVQFSSGEKELSVSLYQAVVLMLFNESDEISYGDIKQQTRLDDAELERTLQSLALGKKQVLKKSTKSRDVKKTDKFRFAADFQDERYLIHINSIQVKETAEETKRTQTSIEQDRKHALDAAIVRVMKGKKELTYEQLKTATIEAVKRHFVPEVAMIKKRIEGLVEQDYLRRDDDDKNKYFYVA
ncbi:Cullin-4B [Daedaleopsis nitida]|nr:Cullin-4B [Daedaleopsis nitida]